VARPLASGSAMVVRFVRRRARPARPRSAMRRALRLRETRRPVARSARVMRGEP